MTKGLEHP